ncbi:MAG: RNA methyltransferase [Anaerolineales bacterium]|nr:RNA methyltransferase [Anaerolineales bacterium]
METIASPANPRIKYVKRIQNDRRFRRREGLFAIETERWLADSLDQGWQPTLLLCSEAWAETPAGKDLLARVTAPTLLITPALLRDLSETQTPAGFLALLPIPVPPPPANPDLLLILDQIRDPGNLGTIIRAAAAAGASAVVLTPGSVDPYNPKVVRATMGTLARLPLLELDWPEINARWPDLPAYMATGAADLSYDELDWRQPAALIIGGEADGASEAARARATGRIKIEMANEVESLNAAMACSIILFEAARQRRRRPE